SPLLIVAKRRPVARWSSAELVLLPYFPLLPVRSFKEASYELAVLSELTVDCLTKYAALDEYIASNRVLVFVCEVLPVLRVFLFHHLDAPAQRGSVQHNFLVPVVMD